MVTGVIQQHLIEFAAPYLPSLAALMVIVVGEIEGFAEFAVLAHKLHAMFLDKMGLTHPV